MRSPSRSASASRFSTMAATPSLMTMPSASRSKLRATPCGESACVLLKQKYENTDCIVSTPPAIAIEQRPLSSACTAASTAAKEDAQAASTVKFAPPKSNRFATRPADTLSKMPGNDSSVHSGRRVQTAASGCSTMRLSSLRVAYCWPKSALPPLAPKITEVFSRSNSLVSS